MPIEFRCDQCGKLLRTADATAGKQARCPSCGNIQAVPGQPSTAPAIPPVPLQAAAPPPSFSSPQPNPSLIGPLPPHSSAATSDAPFSAPPSVPVSSGPAANVANPYVSPDLHQPYDPYAYMPAVGDPLVAQRKMLGPAIGLIVTAILGFGFHGVMALVGFAQLANGEPPEETVPGIVAMFFNLALYLFIVIGAYNMKNVRQYWLCMTTAIAVMLPCGCCFWLGLPFGIWALVALSDPVVKNSFH